MGKPKTYEDYIKLAEKRKFTFIGDDVPRSVKIPTYWRCNLCGRVRRLPYNVFKYVEPACRCRTRFGSNDQDYHRFAAEVGVEWVGDEVPRTVHDTTDWKLPDGTVIRSSRALLRRKAL